MSTTALPLSQKILHWLAVALGYSEDYFPGHSSSWGTFKNAGKDQVLRCWDGLVADSARMLGVTVTPDKLERLRIGLRTWDQQVSQLDDFGLPLSERMVAILRLAVPELGARLGAFGALALLHCPDPSLAEQEGQVLCRPLAASFFGDMLELLLRRHRPEWTTWDLRYEMIEQGADEKGISQRSIERWRSDRLILPSPKLLDPLARVIGGNSTQDRTRALGMLRYARAMTMLRRDLAHWSGPLLAEQFTTVVHLFAAHAMRALLVRGSLETLIETLVTSLESTHGQEAVEALVHILGSEVRQIEPKDLAERLRSELQRFADQPVGKESSWLLASQVIAPHPLLLGSVGASLRAPAAFFIALNKPVDLLRQQWERRRQLHEVAKGSHLVTVRPGGGQTPHAIPPHLSKIARRLLDSDTLVRGPDHLPEKEQQILALVLMLDLQGLARGQEGAQELLDTMNKVDLRSYMVDPEHERHLDDQMIMGVPPMMAARAARLAREGRHAEALEWVKHWKESSSLRTLEERMAIAHTTISIGHTLIDQVSEVRAFLHEDYDVPPELLPRELLEVYLQTASTAQAGLRRVAAQVEKLAAIGIATVGMAETDRERADVLVSILPLALRLAYLRSDTTLAEDPDLSVPEEIAQAIQHLLGRLPNHGGLWAMLALWQRCTSENDDFATARAEHFGFGDLLDKETERIAEELGLSEDDGSG